MNGGPTAERVYDALRRRILENGFRPGQRLDPAELADALASSVTPVRDALHRLVGEALVDARAGGGFHLPLVDEPGLADLYSWNAEVLLTALRAAGSGPVGAARCLEAMDHAERTQNVFAKIAARSSNLEHRRAIWSAGARLHAVRRVEPAVLADVQSEIDALEVTAANGDAAALRRLILVYHRRRSRSAAVIVRALYRGG